MRPVSRRTRWRSWGLAAATLILAAFALLAGPSSTRIVHAASGGCTNYCTYEGIQYDKYVDLQQPYVSVPALITPGTGFHLDVRIQDPYHDSGSSAFYGVSDWMGGVSWSPFDYARIQQDMQGLQNWFLYNDTMTAAIAGILSNLHQNVCGISCLDIQWGSQRANEYYQTWGDSGTLTAPSSPGTYGLHVLVAEYQRIAKNGVNTWYFDDPGYTWNIAVGYPSSPPASYTWYAFDGCHMAAAGNQAPPEEWINKWLHNGSTGTNTLESHYLQNWDVPSQCDPHTATWHLNYTPHFYTGSAQIQGYTETAPTPAHSAEDWVQWNQYEGWNGKHWFDGAQQLPTQFPTPPGSPGTEEGWSTCLAIQGSYWYYNGPLAGHGWYPGAWGPWSCNNFTAYDGVPQATVQIGVGDTAASQPVPYLNPGPSGNIGQAYGETNTYVPPGTWIQAARWMIQGPNGIWGYDTNKGWGNYNWQNQDTFTWPTATDLPTNYTAPGLWTLTLQVQDNDGAWSPVNSGSQQSFTIGGQALSPFVATGCASPGNFSGFVPDTHTYWTGSWPTQVSKHAWVSDGAATQPTTKWCQPTTIPISNQPTSCVPRDPGWAYWTRRYETALTFPSGPVNISTPLNNQYRQYDPQACPVPLGY